jgi:hypothetical protein
MLSLYAHQRTDDAMADLAREVIKELAELEKDEHALLLLRRIQQGRQISGAERELARRLRNQNLITHSTELLAATDEVMLTDLGHYVSDEIDDVESGA